MQTSESIAKLAPALVAASLEFKATKKLAVNPAFHGGTKYADLETVIDATRDALLKNGIVVVQSPGGGSDMQGQAVTVTTRIVHSSGEWIEDTIALPGSNRGKFDAQSVGSAITYARRYSYMGILGIAAEDDDGNAVSHQDKPTVQRASAKPFSTLVEKMSPASQAEIKRGTEEILKSAELQDHDFPTFDENGEPVGDAYEAPKPVDKPITQIAKAGQFDAAPDDAISEPKSKRLWAIAIEHGKKAELPKYLASIGISDAKKIPFRGKTYERACDWAAQ